MRIAVILNGKDPELIAQVMTTLMLQSRMPDEIRVYSNGVNLPTHWRWHLAFWGGKGVPVVFKWFRDVREDGLFSFGGTFARYYKDALEESKADAFWLLQEDVIPGSDCLLELEMVLEAEDAEAVVPRFVVNSDLTTNRDAVSEWLASQESADVMPMWGILIRREALERVIPYYSKFIVGEDMAMTNFLKPKVARRAVVLHFKDAFDYGRGISFNRAIQLFDQIRRFIVGDEK